MLLLMTLDVSVRDTGAQSGLSQIAEHMPSLPEGHDCQPSTPKVLGPRRSPVTVTLLCRLCHWASADFIVWYRTGCVGVCAHHWQQHPVYHDCGTLSHPGEAWLKWAPWEMFSQAQHLSYLHRRWIEASGLRPGPVAIACKDRP